MPCIYGWWDFSYFRYFGNSEIAKRLFIDWLIWCGDFGLCEFRPMTFNEIND